MCSALAAKEVVIAVRANQLLPWKAHLGIVEFSHEPAIGPAPFALTQNSV